MAKCCARWQQRLYYSIISAILMLILFIQLVTLGTFGVQFSSTNSYWSQQVESGGTVCVLYGDEPKDLEANIALPTSAGACGFVLWAIVTTILISIVWIVVQVFMAIIGKPKM